MALTAVFTTFGGIMVHENRGGVETEYIPDPLGSCIGCRSMSGVSTYGATYWPFGEIRSETGSNSSKWGFIGLLGYYRDFATLLYVRARFYKPDLGRWLTIDPLWPLFSQAYLYCKNSPGRYVDPSGLNPLGFLVACGIAVGIGLIKGIGSWLNNGPPAGQIACESVVNCLLNGLVAWLVTIGLGLLISCTLAIIANILRIMLLEWCACKFGKNQDACNQCGFDFCDGLQATMQGLASCFVGDLNQWSDEIAGIVNSIVGSVVSAVGDFLGAACDKVSNIEGGMGFAAQN